MTKLPQFVTQYYRFKIGQFLFMQKGLWAYHIRVGIISDGTLSAEQDQEPDPMR